MSVPMKPDDPCYFMLFDGNTSAPEVYRASCYICRDPEFAQMGLPLCRKCPKCVIAGREGHIPGDSTTCDDCGYQEIELIEEDANETKHN